MNFDKEMKVAEAAIKKSGKLLLEYFDQEEKLVKHAKGVNDFATEADLASEGMIVDSIKKNFQSHSIISEEMGSFGESEFKWIIDPLDGTKNFASHIPLWVPMIALRHKNDIVFSIISLPVMRELCIAEKGKGTFLNGKRVYVSKNKDAKDMVYFCGLRKYDNPLIKKSFDSTVKAFYGQLCLINSIGVAAVLTASGRMDAIINVGFANNYIWDMAPTYLAIKEAGGLVTDISGKPWSESSKDFIAANPKLHRKIISMLG